MTNNESTINSYMSSFFQQSFKIVEKIKLKKIFMGFLALCATIIMYTGVYNRGAKTYINLTTHENSTIDLISVSQNESAFIQNKPIVLYWNKYFQRQYVHFIPNEKTNIQCSYDCTHTTNRSYGADAKVRIFFHRGFNYSDIPPDNSEALNVYYILEPPYLSFSRYSEDLVPPDYFNVSASYRTSSEIYYPYDYFIERDGSETADQIWTEEQIDQKIAGKQEAALIAMSNCEAQSKRHEYVKVLDEFMNVTKLGRCLGTIKCEKNKIVKAQRDDIDCMQKLINIAASDFESPQGLVNYLTHLMNNLDEYKKYFGWTKKYRKNRLTEEETAISCQLCKLAHQNKPYRIENYKEYWSNKECVKNYGLHLLSNHTDNRKYVVNGELKLSSIMNSTYRLRSVGRIL